MQGLGEHRADQGLRRRGQPDPLQRRAGGEVVGARVAVGADDQQVLRGQPFGEHDVVGHGGVGADEPGDRQGFGAQRVLGDAVTGRLPAVGVRGPQRQLTLVTAVFAENARGEAEQLGQLVQPAGHDEVDAGRLARRDQRGADGSPAPGCGGSGAGDCVGG